MEQHQFVDEARLFAFAGDGGNGAASFERRKYQPKGRPDGGNGGDGGSVVLRADPNISTLAEVARAPHQRADRGRNGSGNDKHGSNAPDRTVLVPLGTVVKDERGDVLGDLVSPGAEFVAAKGGRGGRGNAAFATAKRRAPGFSERGEPGEQRVLLLELKVLADVGLVGFPNAGKSSLISRLSAARPRIAAYPFTTLTPNLGVAETADGRFVVADVPGLIEGASQGRGLGLAFLRHLERCRVLCYVLDVSGSDAPDAALDALRGELRAYRGDLEARAAVVVANKIDVPGTEEAMRVAEQAAASAGYSFVAVSALHGEGIETLSEVLTRAVAEAREAESARKTHRVVRLRPAEHDVRIEREDSAWRVRSDRVERVLTRFDISNPDALAFVQERLKSYGVEDSLWSAGARRGDEVRIGDHAFEFEPEREPDGDASERTQ